MKISIVLGKRVSDELELDLVDITDAEEIYNSVFRKTDDYVKAALAVEKVNSADFTVLED
jgi:hypothetical protein